MPECKVITCCDLDDFPASSSGEGNCPEGWQWDGVSCVRCAIPAAPSLTPAGGGLIDMTFHVEPDTHDGRLYRIERSEGGHWMTLFSGMSAFGPEGFTDDLAVPGTTYLYRITVAVSSVCGYIEGESASVVAV